MESNVRNHAVRSVKPRLVPFLPGRPDPVSEPFQTGQPAQCAAPRAPRGRGASPHSARGRARRPAYRRREAGPPPELSGAEVPAPGLPTPAATMDAECAASRLRVVLGHLRRPSAATVVSFGLRGARAGRGVASRAIAQSPRRFFPLLRAQVPWWLRSLPRPGAEGGGGARIPRRSSFGLS